jgi:5-methylcytosine-specific restriction endonuclease McrA
VDRKTIIHIAKVLRRGTLTWHGRNEALAKVSKKKWEGKKTKKGKKILKTYWQCLKCLEWFRDSSSLEVDHIIEVGKMPERVEEILDYAKRLYDAPNLQCLCSVCHQKKTSGYNATRKYKRKS